MSLKRCRLLPGSGQRPCVMWLTVFISNRLRMSFFFSVTMWCSSSGFAARPPRHEGCAVQQVVADDARLVARGVVGGDGAGVAPVPVEGEPGADGGCATHLEQFG